MDNVIQFPTDYEGGEYSEPIPQDFFVQPNPEPIHITLEVAPGVPPVSPLWANTFSFVVTFLLVLAVITAVMP